LLFYENQRKKAAAEIAVIARAAEEIHTLLLVKSVQRSLCHK
jgi:hypothetical protein